MTWSSSTPDHRPVPVEGLRVRERLDEILGDRSDREVALVARMVSGFPEKARTLIGQMLGSLAEDDLEGAAHQVHSLKGTALNLGAVELPSICERVEDDVRGGAWSGDPEQVRPLTDAAARFAALLEGESLWLSGER